jgi:hypothetical protein
MEVMLSPSPMIFDPDALGRTSKNGTSCGILRPRGDRWLKVPEWWSRTRLSLACAAVPEGIGV